MIEPPHGGGCDLVPLFRNSSVTDPRRRCARASVDWAREDKGLAGNRRLEHSRLVELAQQFLAKKIRISLREVLKVCITPSKRRSAISARNAAVIVS